MNGRHPFWITAAWLAMVPAFAQEIPDRTLTLDESVHLALNNSEALLSSREDVDIALQRVRQTESLFFPTLDLNANWSKFRVQGNTPLLLDPALGPTLITSSPRENFFTARASIYQSVYEGGRSQNLWRQARISYDRAKNANEALQTQVAASAKQVFYDLLFAQQKKRYLDDLLRKNEDPIRRHAGSLTEQLRFESELALIRTRASEAVQAEQDAQRAYLQTLNLELNTTIALRGNFETHPMTLDLPKLLAWSAEYRSELRQTEYQQELDALGVGLSLAERRPTIGFGASYQRSGYDLDILPTADWAGTLNINLPVNVSDLVFGWAKVRERRALYRQATLKHAEVSDQVQLQVRQAYDQVKFWQNELAPRQESLQRLESISAELEKQHAPLAERLEAERIVMEARIRFLEAVHGHLSALATLERAVGKALGDER
jgi:outer membrane protein TolC